MVNSAVLNDYLLIAGPDGPLANDMNLLQEEIKRLLSGVPLHPVFLDYTPYHYHFNRYFLPIGRANLTTTASLQP